MKAGILEGLPTCYWFLKISHYPGSHAASDQSLKPIHSSFMTSHGDRPPSQMCSPAHRHATVVILRSKLQNDKIESY